MTLKPINVSNLHYTMDPETGLFHLIRALRVPRESSSRTVASLKTPLPRFDHHD